MEVTLIYPAIREPGNFTSHENRQQMEEKCLRHLLARKLGNSRKMQMKKRSPYVQLFRFSEPIAFGRTPVNGDCCTSKGFPRPRTAVAAPLSRPVPTASIRPSYAAIVLAAACVSREVWVVSVWCSESSADVPRALLAFLLSCSRGSS